MLVDGYDSLLNSYDVWLKASTKGEINNICLALAEGNRLLDALIEYRQERQAVISKQSQLVSDLIDRFAKIPTPLISPVLKFAELLGKHGYYDELSRLVDNVKGFVGEHTASAEIRLFEINMLLDQRRHEELILRCRELSPYLHFLSHRRVLAEAHYALGIALISDGKPQEGTEKIILSLLANPSKDAVQTLKVFYSNSWTSLLLLSQLPFIVRILCGLEMLRLGWVGERLAYLARYITNYYMPPNQNGSGILVMRAMGGIGDLLMMTAGFELLHRKYPKQRLDLAIHRKFFPIFEHNPTVNLLDISELESNRIFEYRLVFNLTECPASRVESRTAPNVKANRTDIFANALGASRSVLAGSNRQLIYNIGKAEQDNADAFWRENGLDQDGSVVIGLQLTTADPYKDHPNMRELIAMLAEKYRVLVFALEHTGYDEHPNVIAVRESLPNVLALIGRCHIIVAPDSAFVHVAGALDIPCVAIFGPTDGKVFTRYYKRCRYLDARREYSCIPCWRNQHQPCKLTNSLLSACMTGISVEVIAAAVEQQLEKYPLAAKA